MKFGLLHIAPLAFLLYLFGTSDGRGSKMNQCNVGRKIKRNGTCPQTHQNEKRAKSKGGRLSTEAFLLNLLGSATSSKSEISYYVSINNATWTEAEQNCVNAFGQGSGLVSIETKEENDFLKHLLETSTPGGVYWTGGKYYPQEKLYRWSTTQVLLPNEGTEWGYKTSGGGQPTSSPDSQTRVALHHISRYKSAWFTERSSLTHRYICETTSNTKKDIPCHEELDLDIVLDSSHRSDRIFQYALNTISYLMEGFQRNPRVRIGLVQFASHATRKIVINNILAIFEMVEIVQTLKLLKGLPSTHLGMNSSFEELLKKRRNLQVPLKMLVIMGNRPSGLRQLESVAKKVNKKVKVYAVAMDRYNLISNSDLLTIAGSDKDRIFRAFEFKSISDLVLAIYQQICLD